MAKHQPVEPEVERETDSQSLQSELALLRQQVQDLAKAAAGGASGLTPETLEAVMARVAKMTAEAQDRMLHPDNRDHPGISVYSYPEGDKAKPRDPLKVPMSWVGYPLTTDTLMAQEIELLNRAEPGEYTFRRTDGTTDKLIINADRDVLSQVTRLHFVFPVKERRDTLPSMTDMLRTAFGIKSPEQEELDRLRAEVERLKAVPA